MFDTALVARLATLDPQPNLFVGAAPEGFDDPANLTAGESVYPVLIYNTISTDPLEGVGEKPTHAWKRVQLDVYDPDYGTAKELAATVRANLVDWKDGDVLAVRWIDESDWLDQTKTTSLHSVMLSFLMLAVI